jgi:hypothetical protein
MCTQHIQPIRYKEKVHSTHSTNKKLGKGTTHSINKKQGKGALNTFNQ